MSKGQKDVKINKNLVNLKMDKKIKKSFNAVFVGIIVMGVLSLANILIYSKAAGISVFSNFSRSVGFILFILAFLLNLSLLKVVARDLTNVLVVPIRQLQRVVQKIKQGEFDTEIQYESEDELGELATDLCEASTYLQTIVTDAGSVLREMADGKFNASSDAEESYVGEFAALIESINKLSENLNGTLRKIRVSSEQVMVGADQLASSAQDLAEGATNQAASVEELSANVENVTNISKESAKNAVTAATSAMEAAESAKKSREEFNQLTEAMERITVTSKEIEDIIAAIEDIASQTNLLSLNASIEAARAGEAGRGFAVVADQIGKLAADSAQSAVTTRELISKSLVEVEGGNAIVENTMVSFNKVMEDMEAFAEMASGAAEASKTQVDMLEQIETGIEQITMVVQNNSATAQETSAVSEELSAQATNLEQMVEEFELREE